MSSFEGVAHMRALSLQHEKFQVLMLLVDQLSHIYDIQYFIVYDNSSDKICCYTIYNCTHL